MSEVGGIYSKLVLDTSGFESALRSAIGLTRKTSDSAQKDFDKVEKKVKETTEKVKEQKKEISSLESTFKSFGSIISSGAIISGLRSFVSESAKVESTRVAFEVMLGSAERAKQVLSDLNKLSLTTPFTPQQVNSAAKSLLAFGFEADKINSTLRMLGDVSAGTGKDLTELAVIFGQIKSSGRLMGQDLMQLINAGFNPLQIISEKTGKSVAQLKKEMEQGLITFDKVEQAFIDATSSGGMFNDMMQKQSETMEGIASTAEGTFSELKAVIGNELTPIVKSLTKTFIDAMNAVIEFRNNNPALFKTIVQVTTAIAALVSVILGAGGLVMGVKTLIPVVATFGATLNVALGPISVAAAAIAGLATAFLYLKNRAAESRAELARTMSSSVDPKKLNEQIKAVDKILNATEKVSRISETVKQKMIGELVSAGLELEKAEKLFRLNYGLSEANRKVYNLNRKDLQAYREELEKLNQAKKEQIKVSSSKEINVSQATSSQQIISPIKGSYAKELQELESRLESLIELRDKFTVQGSDEWASARDDVIETQKEIDKLKNKMNRLTGQISLNLGIFEPLKQSFSSLGFGMSSFFEAGLYSLSQLAETASNSLATLAQAAQMKFSQVQQKISVFVDYSNALIDKNLQKTINSLELELKAYEEQKNKLIEIERQYIQRREEIRNEEIEKIRQRIEEEYQLQAHSLLLQHEQNVQIQEANMLDEEQRKLNIERLEEEHFQELKDLRLRYDEMTKKEIEALTEKMKKEDESRRISHETELSMIAENEKRIQEQIALEKEQAQKKKEDLEKKAKLSEWFFGKQSFEAGKKAQLAQAQIQMIQGVMSSILAGVLLTAFMSAIVGPFALPMGIALTAALTAMTVSAGQAAISAIASQQYPPPPASAFAKGGLVEGGTPNKDSVPSMLMPGELVVPKQNFEEVVSAVNEQRSGRSIVISGNNFYGIESPKDFVERVKEILLQESRSSVSAFA